MDYFICKDVNGKTVTIEYLEIVEQLKSQGFKLFGMSIDNILEFRKQYQLYDGKMPITNEGIEDVFNIIQNV